jgi:hypothetical protein
MNSFKDLLINGIRKLKNDSIQIQKFELAHHIRDIERSISNNNLTSTEIKAVIQQHLGNPFLNERPEIVRKIIHIFLYASRKGKLKRILGYER